MVGLVHLQHILTFRVASQINTLKILQKDIGNRFIVGITLYTGNQIIPFGEKLFATPV